MVVFHVKPSKFQARALSATIWEFSMQIMNLRAGNASVVPPSIAHEHCSYPLNILLFVDMI